MPLKTEQEKFWKSDFGKGYIERNKSDRLLASNTAFFAKIVERTSGLNSVLELGCNVGMNLKSLHRLLPNSSFTGVEINPEAAKILEEWGKAEVIIDSILEVDLDEKYELTFTKGVLIHLNPDYLKEAYERLYESSSKYILIAEYYNPTPVTIDYRGHKNRLFKRDFAGELMMMYSDLQLVDYGFSYHKDTVFSQDDITWFLMEKK